MEEKAPDAVRVRRRSRYHSRRLPPARRLRRFFTGAGVISCRLPAACGVFYRRRCNFLPPALRGRRARGGAGAVTPIRTRETKKASTDHAPKNFPKNKKGIDENRKTCYCDNAKTRTAIG